MYLDIPCSPQEAGGMGLLTTGPPHCNLACSPALFLDPRKEALEGQELRYLAPLRLAVWYPQHVQGVP